MKWGRKVQSHTPLTPVYIWPYEWLTRHRTVMLCTWAVHSALHTCAAAWNSWFLLCCAPLCPLLPLLLSPWGAVPGIVVASFHTVQVGQGLPGLWGRFNTGCSLILSHSQISKIPPCGEIIVSCCRGSHILSWIKQKEEEKGRKQKAGAENNHWCGLCFGNALL